MAVSSAGRSALRTMLGRWAYSFSGFNQLGLMHDDCLRETDEVKEAVRRLPDHVYDERMFRISRALYLSMKKDILPKEEWTTYDNDVKYLRPYLEGVIQENSEKSLWNSK
ncbi:PREDICTED: cytochrome b-c1 complex subunit 7-like [Priapulus caudatus]|uniref:Cytochrome b-c1 complex subunit 7 n=1 Tax=Priapulus caudatus TaxID=37621 RepID=A0ABM1E0I6_PRICU|nr:PREDICTED: cytochrome b-c1 complex subunit 7-like [Priapulus caudatus]